MNQLIQCMSEINQKQFELQNLMQKNKQTVDELNENQTIIETKANIPKEMKISDVMTVAQMQTEIEEMKKMLEEMKKAVKSAQSSNSFSLQDLTNLEKTVANQREQLIELLYLANSLFSSK